MANKTRPQDGAQRPSRTALQRDLRFVEALALSVAVMAPTAAMALNGTVVAAQIGRAVPLAFLIAIVGVLFVSWGFTRLTRYFNSAGSVMALTGISLGPRVGFFTGWALFGAYLALAIASLAEVGLFGGAFVMHVAGRTPDWLLLALGGAVLMALLCYLRIRVTTRALLGLEGISVALILVLVVILFVKLGFGHAPDGQRLTLDVFRPPPGVGVSAIAAAAVFGFLSFAGFEGAATLGEETRDPRRTIPAAILASVLIAGAFYLVVTTAQALGFGADVAGAKRFSESTAPFNDLAMMYAGSTMAALIDLGAAVSAFAAGLGAATAASRLLFAMARVGFGGERMAETSAKGAPVAALGLVIAVSALALTGLRVAQISAINAFFYPGTLAVLLLLVVYMLTNIGAVRFVFFAGARRAPLRELAVPALALCIIGYVLYKNTDPTGLNYPYNILPVIAGAWLGTGLVAILVMPALALRIGQSFAGGAR